VKNKTSSAPPPSFSRDYSFYTKKERARKNHKRKKKESFERGNDADDEKNALCFQLRSYFFVHEFLIQQKIEDKIKQLFS
jgi:hypothetical protein